MNENTSSFLLEVMAQYGLFGLIVVTILILLIIFVYKWGPMIIEKFDSIHFDDHYKRMMHGIKKGPLVQSELRNRLPNIGCDHIFAAEFHNGTKSISGIPYMKFDIIFEHITPKFHVNDCLLVRLYENEYVQTHDQLPGLLFQNKNITYTLEQIYEIDEQLYLRMKSRGISVIALSIFYNKKHIPAGFVGCFNFENGINQINMDELNKCTREIENIYNK